MQTIHAEKLGKVLRGQSKRPFLESSQNRFGQEFSKGAAGSKPAAFDSFQITKNISELLSPSCGMTEEEKSSYLARIKAKLESGKRLTPEEMRFLQAEDPALYQQAARVQAMRDAFEAQLENATSKENAEQIYSTTVSLVSDDDPMKEFLIAAYDDVMEEFKASDKYKALPDKESDRKK